MHALRKFLPSEANRRLAPAFAAICVAGVGALLGFIASVLSIRWLAMISLAITAMGLIAVLVFILFGMYRTVRYSWRRIKGSNDW